jgi:hypothetical protein
LCRGHAKVGWGTEMSARPAHQRQALGGSMVVPVGASAVAARWVGARENEYITLTNGIKIAHLCIISKDQARCSQIQMTN